jgi:transcription initiation factor TFIIH subunit 1
MKSCHNAATEFLRQYWSAILPLPPGALGGPSASPQARANKAEKMAAYLRLTEGKVDGVVATATAQGISADRVRAVSDPTVRTHERTLIVVIGNVTYDGSCECSVGKGDQAVVKGDPSVIGS